MPGKLTRAGLFGGIKLPAENYGDMGFELTIAAKRDPPSVNMI